MKTTQMVLLMAVLAVPSWAAISITGTCTSVVATPASCTLSATNAGDLELAIGYKNGSRTPATPPTGWTGVVGWFTSAGGNTGSWELACRKSDGLTGSGTWTGSPSLIAVVSYSGTVDPTTCTNAIGTPVTNQAKASTTVTFGGLTLTGGGTSWVAGLDGTQQTDCTSSNLTNEIQSPTGSSAVHTSINDTNGPVSSFSSGTCTVVSSTWGTVTVEVLASTSTSSCAQSISLMGVGCR